MYNLKKTNEIEVTVLIPCTFGLGTNVLVCIYLFHHMDTLIAFWKINMAIDVAAIDFVFPQPKTVACSRALGQDFSMVSDFLGFPEYPKRHAGTFLMFLTNPQQDAP